jgi:ABC-type lipoprotein export system ATPase subunit
MPPALAFEHVSRAYDTASGASRFALRQVTVAVEPGRKVAIVGRSGSGKSTFLHLASGIDVPSEGRVLVDGHDLAAMGEGERTRLRRDRIGIVFQFFHLLPHLSVRENVALPEMIAGTPPGRFEERTGRLLGRVGLGDRGDDPVHRLSGGEMQRVAICRALLRRPRLVLADEPTGNLDDRSSQEVMDLMLELVAEEGSTLVYVTHSRELAQLADETWRLHDGQLERLEHSAPPAATEPPGRP